MTAHNHRMIWSSPSKIDCLGSQLPKYLRAKAFVFDKTLHFVSTKPTVPHEEASWSVLDFGVTVFRQKQTNIELCD